MALNDGTYKVLAFLNYPDGTQGVVADLFVSRGKAQLVFEWHVTPQGDKPKTAVCVERDELDHFAPSQWGADFLLRNPIWLDEEKATLVFGPSRRPPAQAP
jgi:hypothetical protein